MICRVACGAATVDVVVCDLTRDPRSEDYVPEPTVTATTQRSGFFPARCAAPVVDEEERPPSTPRVGALK